VSWLASALARGTAWGAVPVPTAGAYGHFSGFQSGTNPSRRWITLGVSWLFAVLFLKEKDGMELDPLLLCLMIAAAGFAFAVQAPRVIQKKIGGGVIPWHRLP